MKVWNYVFIAVTMIIFLQFAGFPTAFNGIFGFFNIAYNEDNSLASANIDTSNFINFIFGNAGWLAGLLAGAVTIGLFLAGEPTLGLKAGLCSSIFFAFVPTLYFAVTEALARGISSWAVGILALIFIPFTVGFCIALFEYVIGGND